MNGYPDQPTAALSAGYTSQRAMSPSLGEQQKQGHLGSLFNEQAGTIAELGKFIDILYDRLGPVLMNAPEKPLAGAGVPSQAPLNDIGRTISGHSGVLRDHVGRLQNLLSLISV